MVGDANESNIEIYGKNVSALIDSGAMVSSLSEDFYNSLEPRPILHDLTDFKLDVYAADGNQLPYSGYIEAEIVLPFIRSENKSILVPMLVTPVTEYRKNVPVVIGTNVIRMY